MGYDDLKRRMRRLEKAKAGNAGDDGLEPWEAEMDKEMKAFVRREWQCLAEAAERGDEDAKDVLDRLIYFFGSIGDSSKMSEAELTEAMGQMCKRAMESDDPADMEAFMWFGTFSRK